MVFEMREAQSVAREMAKQAEEIMLEQLGDLVTSGLLVWESTSPIITMDYANNKLKISQMGRLRLRDQEVLDNLKAENKDLKDRLVAIQSAIAGS